MAGIDKTYFKSWEEYKEARDFVLSFGQVTDEYGNKFYPSDFMNLDWTEEEVEKELAEQRNRAREYYRIPGNLKREQEWLKDKSWKPNYEEMGELVLWNTPLYFDVWLIRNCKVPFIVNRLREQYRSEFDDILGHVSIYDQPKNIDRGYHFSIWPSRFRSCREWVSIQPDIKEDLVYDEDLDFWSLLDECRSWNTSTAIFKNLGPRKLRRKIKKWNLPVGSRLVIYTRQRTYNIKIGK